MPEAQPIVLLDDDENIADLLAAALRFEGFDVEGYTNLQVCSARLLHPPAPCLFIIDYHIGTTTSAELLKELRAAGVCLPVVCFTGLPLSPGERAELQSLGVAEVLTKPIDLDSLKGVIASLRREGCQS